MTSKRKETDEEIERDFHVLVNMSATELGEWLKTEESRTVGWHREGEDEAIGHQSGRRIIQIVQRRKANLSEGDHAHMRKVVGYIKRHLAQPPHRSLEHTRWRYSLMNWGHDPLKDGRR
jgi:hypothetical protein